MNDVSVHLGESSKEFCKRLLKQYWIKVNVLYITNDSIYV